jgi:hypothetical protein
MGRMGLEAMIEEGGEALALIWHLRANLYPPMTYWGDAAAAALAAVREGDPDRQIELPTGVTVRADGSSTSPASTIVGALQLDAFLEAP